MIFINLCFHICRPRNLFVDKDCNLKIGDFGLARVLPTVEPITSAEMTDYVTTRWYRAPEVLVGYSSYSTSVDMWSVGCIVAELIQRRPLFSGSDSSEQMQLIVNRLKYPTEQFLQKVKKSSMRQVSLCIYNVILHIHHFECISFCMYIFLFLFVSGLFLIACPIQTSKLSRTMTRSLLPIVYVST